MKTLLAAPVVPHGFLRFTYGWLVTAALLCTTSTLPAQSILVGTPKTTLTPRVIQDDITPDPASSDVLAGPDTRTPIEFGRIKLRPQLLLRYMQANGLPTGAGATTDSSVVTFAPGLGVELGSNWILNYAPTWINYSEKTLTDSTSQSASVNGAAIMNEWTFRFGESFNSSEDILVETGTQTKQHNWATELSASRKVGLRSKYDGTLTLDERYGDSFPDSKTWATDHWFRMQFTPKINAGLGLNLSKTDILNGDDMHSEAYTASIRWQPTEKVDLSIQRGFEIRHFDTPGVGSLRSPTLQASLGYRPFDHTRITLEGTRAVSNSFFTNEVVQATGWSISLSQRLLEKLNLSMTYHDQASDYTSFATPTLPEVRSDDFKSFNTSLGVVLLKHWTLSVICQNSKNTSDQTGHGFSTTQYGIELSGGF